MRKGILIFLLIASFIPTFNGAVHAQTKDSAATEETTTSTDTNGATMVPIDNERAGSDDRGDSTNKQEGSYERAIVKTVGTSESKITGGGEQKKQYTVEYLSGPLKGQTKILSSDLDSNPYSLNVAPGDKVVVFLQPNPAGGDPIGFLESFDRRGAMLWLVVLFVLMLVVLAGWQGMKVAFSIMTSIALIAWILIPAFLNGVNPVPVAILLSAALSALSSVLATGWSRKSFVTVIGTIGGTLVAYAVSLAFSHWAHLGGLNTEEDRLFFEKNPLLNPEGLLFAGIIIASMGVVEDVAVSIASGVVEVFRANPRLDFQKLFRSGMVVGRDHMSALANTLIFAYVGGSLSTLLLYTQYGGSWLKFLNFDSVVDEVVRSLSGTIGLIFTVPITALLAAFVCVSARGAKQLNAIAATSENPHQHHHHHPHHSRDTVDHSS